MNKRKIGRVSSLTALNVLCSNMTQNMVKQLLSSDVSEWENTYKGKCFKKTGDSTDEVTLKYINNSIGISGWGLAENVNLQTLGNKGGGYIENPIYYIGVNDTDYKNPRLYIADLQSECDVYEITENFDPNSKAIQFEIDNSTVHNNFKMYLVYENADGETRNAEINTSNCRPFNCDDITLYFQQGVNPIFNDKSEFRWRAQLGVATQLYQVSSVLSDNNLRCNGYKFMNNSYSVNCRVYDNLSDAEINDPKNSVNAQDESSDDAAEDRTTVLYYNDRVSVTTFGFNDTTDYFTHSIQFKIQYKTNAGEKITEPRNSIVGYVKSSVDPVTFSNIEWVYNKDVKIVECKWSYGLVGGTKHTGTKPPDNIPDIMCFYDQAQIDNKVYKAKFGTNMVIFANKSDAERFTEGDKTVRPLYDGHSGRFDDTGDIGDKYSYNTQSYTIDNDMSSVWILTKEQLNELASVLATGLTKSEAESGQTLLNITKTTARSFTAQAEPVDMICDLFWVPIDVSEFCVTHTDYLQFGQDTYGAAGALDEFVDETTGQVVKAARTSSRSIEALTGGIFETIGSAVSDSKLNVRSESVTPPPSNT